MQNIILITFKSGLIQYIPHSLEALDFISANFADIETYIVVKPATQQKPEEKPGDKPPVDLSELTKREVIALAAALKSIEVETGGEFGTLDGAYEHIQTLTSRNFRKALLRLEEECFVLSNGSFAYLYMRHDKKEKYTRFNVSKDLYKVRQYVYDQAGLK